MKKIARTLRSHHDLILNWFIAKREISSGAVEGMNTNAKLAIRKARGFRTYEALETALYHQLGHLVLSGNSSRKLWLKFADFRGSYRTGGARSTPWMKQGCRSDGPAVMVIWARLLRFVVWPPCLGQRTALRHL